MKTSFLLVLAILISSCGKSDSKKNLNLGKRNDDLVVSDNFTYSLLEDSRNKIISPEMSDNERKILITQSKMVLSELYVNRLKKIKTYGQQIDPIAKLDRFEKEHINSSSEVFHQELANIYSSQRDLHTWYSSPSPRGCYVAFLPFAVTPAKDSRGVQVAVVSRIRLWGKTLALAPELINLSVGDILQSLNDRSTKEELASLATYNSGSNNQAFNRTAYNLLTYRSLSTLPLPADNSITLKFKKQNGDLFTISLPWIVFEDTDCLKESTNSTGMNISETAENNMITKYEKFYKTKIISPKKSGPFIMSKITDNNNKNKVHGLVVINSLTETAEPTISWWSFKNENGTFGVIKLSSFSPEKLNILEAKVMIANLMSVQMSTFDGIIFDLRNNGGGKISYGQSLAELVSAKSIDVLKFQLLNTPATRHYFSVAEPSSPFTKELIQANTTNLPMTAAIPLSNADQIFKKGQAFFKPVAIFTNANCYSTCDMMSALFQDHGLAEIWAEDAQTGAGGANNWDYNDLISYLPKDKLGPFQKLPFNINIGFAFRQTVRTGLNAGVLLEDEGVKADHILETSVEDVVTNGLSQFAKISQSLASKKGDYLAWADFNSKNSLETTNDQLDLLIDFKATEKIQVFHKKIQVAEVNVDYSLEAQTVSIGLPMKILDKNFGDIEIKGTNKNSFVWRKVTTIRKISAPIKIAQNEEFILKFDNNPSPINVYNIQDDENLGWRIDGQTLRIGTFSGYADKVNSTASIFVDLSDKKNAVLSFNMEYYTEPSFDFVEVAVVGKSKKLAIIPAKTSGVQTNKNFVADLSQFNGQKIELRFSFQSDEGGIDKGVWVSNLKIK